MGDLEKAELPDYLSESMWIVITSKMRDICKLGSSPIEKQDTGKFHPGRYSSFLCMLDFSGVVQN